MIYKNFTEDLKISAITLGCDGYGTDVERKVAFDMLDLYTYQGGNTIDTARMYTNGTSEQIIGDWLTSRKTRNKVIISTKCAHPPLNDMAHNRLSRNEIFSDVDNSLKALRCDYIDILWLHRDDKNVFEGDIIDTLNELVHLGKIRLFGASNWSGERIKKANDYALKTNQLPFCASQIKWCIAHSAPNYKDDPTLIEMNKNEYNFYKENKIGVFAYASQAKGFFYKYDNGGEDALSEKARKRYLSEENIKIYHKLKEICNTDDISLTCAVISSLCSNTDFPTTAIVGCKNTSQLKTTLEAADVTLNYRKILEILKY